MTTTARPRFIWIPTQPVDPDGCRRVYLGGRARRITRRTAGSCSARLVDLPSRAEPATFSITGRRPLPALRQWRAHGPRTGALQPALPALRRLRPRRCPAQPGATSSPSWSTPTASTPPSTRPPRAVATDLRRRRALDGWSRRRPRGETVDLASDESWRCLQSDAWTQNAAAANHSLGFIEDLDAARLPDGLDGARLRRQRLGCRRGRWSPAVAARRRPTAAWRRDRFRLFCRAAFRSSRSGRSPPPAWSGPGASPPCRSCPFTGAPMKSRSPNWRRCAQTIPTTS